MVVKIIGKYIFLIYWNIKNDKIIDIKELL